MGFVLGSGLPTNRARYARVNPSARTIGGAESVTHNV